MGRRSLKVRSLAGVAFGVCITAAGACSNPKSAAVLPTLPTTTRAPTTTVPQTDLYRSTCLERVATGPVIPVRSAAVIEASGIEASRDRLGWFWVHNDSGDVPRFFGVGPGGQVQVVSVSGAQAVDWEDIAADHTPAGDGFWLADIGDNVGTRPDVVLYRVPEPGPGATSVTASALTLRYPDGPHNAEALLRDPADGTLIILTKEPGMSRIYTFRPPATGGLRGTLRAAGRFRVGRTPRELVTAADVSPDRSTIAVRTYGGLYMYRVQRGQSIVAALQTLPCDAPHAIEVQGEAVAFLADGRGYATISEGARPSVAQFREAVG